MPNKRYAVGQKFKALPVYTWGNLVDAAEREQDIVNLPSEQRELSCVRVSVTNNVGVNIPAGGVIGLGDSEIDPNDTPSLQLSDPIIKGVSPTDGEKFGIVHTTIISRPDSKAIGPVSIAGACWAKVDIKNPGHISAGVETGITANLITPGVIPIIWKPSGTGIKLCLIQLSSPAFWIRRAIATGTITAGGSGPITYTDGGGTGTAFMDHVGADSGDDITTDRKLFVAQFFTEDNRVRVISADCEPDIASAPPGHGDDVDASSTDTLGEGQLNFRVNRVTTTSGSPHVITLDNVSQGEDCIVRNASGSTLKCYPDSAGSAINGATAGTAISINNGVTARFHKVQSDEWVW